MEKVKELSAAYYNKALNFINENKISKAVNYIRKSLKLYSKDVDTLNLMGICKYILCEFDEAYFYWNKSLEYSENENRAEYYISILKSRKFNRIIKVYNEALEEINNSAYKSSIEKLKEIIKEESDLLEPYIIISLCYYMLGKYNLSKRYIEMALNIDKENKKCLLYLNEINNKKNIPIIKYKSNKVTKTVACVSTLLLITSVFFQYKNHKSYIDIKDSLAKYQQKYKLNNTELQLIRGKYNKLNNDIQQEKMQIQKKFINKSDGEVFNDAIASYRKKDYKNALNSFSNIVDKGISQSVVAESTYFLAVCYEKLNNTKKSEEFYCKYIEHYKRENYYDDSLYNYGIMLYRQGNKEKAKNILKTLESEVPDSIFVNKTVRFILNN